MQTPTTQLTKDWNQHYLIDKSLLARLGLAYLVFIIYGSLLPLNMNNLEFATAWENFQQIPLLKLGVGSRADLVANLLLYIPFGFLVYGGLVGQSRRLLVIITGIVLTFLYAVIVVLCIEFSQQFFPPRTVSLNDILAEFAGVVIGVGLWLVMGPRLVFLFKAIAAGGANTRHALLIVYTICYLGLSLFPFDFLMSVDEWQMKLASDMVGWLFVPNCGVACAWRLIPEVLLVVPIALVIFSSRQHISLLLVASIGAVLGVLIEILQLTIASGISQGASVISRVVGMMLGVGLLQIASKIDWQRIRRYTHARVILVFCIFPYLGVLTWANGWFSGGWLGLSVGWGRLEAVHFLPFYYHYYSTETAGLVSFIFQSGLYLPVGLWFWLWHWTTFSNKWEFGQLWPATFACMLAIIVETGKLFVSGLRPDPTDVLIAVVTAMVVYHLLSLMSLSTPNKQNLPAAPMQAQSESGTAIKPINLFGVVGSLALCAAAVAALSSPFGMLWVTLPLLAYAGLLWWRPEWWLVWVLALLPLLDLTPWSGRLFWTEFDSLLLVTIGVCYLRLLTNLDTTPALHKVAKLLLVLFVLSAVISMAIGIFPFAELDHNAFSSYTSPYNALRVVKGLLFALAFIPLLACLWNKPESATQNIALGMTFGLTCVVLYVLWERATFSGLFNFETDYRITGPFHGMHVGGAYIETYLAATLPFVAFWGWQQQRVWTSVVAICLFGLGTYSIMVTFSRTGQAAFLLAIIIMVLGFVRLMLQQRSHHIASTGAIVIFVCVMMAVTWPIFSGEFSQSRWANVKQDIALRSNHWIETLAIFRLQDSAILGVGLGSFPSAYYWGSSSPSRSATYTFLSEKDDTFLRLGSGRSLYFEQSVATLPEQQYTLAINLRSSSATASLTAFVCEKALLYSYTCVRVPIPVNSPVGEWESYQAQFYTYNFGPPNSKIHRPIKLSLSNAKNGTTIDVDDVMLIDSAGNNLIRNGDFSVGMHHWSFSVDNFWPWHIENVFLNILFEQGWFGLICFVALIIYAMARWLSYAWNKDAFSIVLCASIAAFLVVGLLNSWNDEPRLSFLFYFLLIAGLVADRHGQSVRR